MKSLDIMKKIDSAIFSKIDEFESRPEFQKLADSYSSLEEKNQEAIKIIMAIIIFLIPLFLIFIFSNINDSAKEELNLKEEIILYANEVISTQSKVQQESFKILGRQLIDNQTNIEQKIINTMKRVGVDPAKLQVSNFEANELSGNIMEAKIVFKFDGLTNEQIFGALAIMIEQDKMRIENFNIKKNSSSNMLDGVLTILYFSKINNES